MDGNNAQEQAQADDAQAAVENQSSNVATQNAIAENQAAGRAKGGPLRKGQKAVVGEEGPELFVPDRGGRRYGGPRHR